MCNNCSISLFLRQLKNSGEKMKSYIKWFLAFTCLLILTMCQTQQTFTGKFKIDPQNAKPGDKITVYYNPDSTNLAGKKNIECTAYFYNSDLINTVDVPLEQKNNFWQGSLKINNEAYGIIFNFNPTVGALPTIKAFAIIIIGKGFVFTGPSIFGFSFADCGTLLIPAR